MIKQVQIIIKEGLKMRIGNDSLYMGVLVKNGMINGSFLHLYA